MVASMKARQALDDPVRGRIPAPDPKWRSNAQARSPSLVRITSSSLDHGSWVPAFQVNKKFDPDARSSAQAWLDEVGNLPPGKHVMW